MMEATAAAYAESETPDDWYIYHDALSLMTSHETRDWMQTKGYLQRWILPLHGLNDNLPYFQARPPGNSPELMPMDAYINRYWHTMVSRHVRWSEGMSETETVMWQGKAVRRQFSDRCPKRQTEAYLRLWDSDSGWDLSKSILKDIRRFLQACSTIRDDEGAVGHDCSLRNGHRALWYLDGNKPKRGGYHPKGPCKPVQFHHRDIPKEQVSRRGTESMATFDKVDE
jgi:hypothetical protein